MRSTATDIPTGWQPDPFGEHELRLFSPEGSPTAHVSTAGRNSYDEVPGAVIVDPPRVRRVASSTTNRTGRAPTLADWRTPVEAPSGHRPDRIGHARTRVRQLARLLAAITLLTTRDRTRPRRPLVPAFSTIILAAMREDPARHDPLEPARSRTVDTTAAS
jgi:hypothetical protein